MNDYLIEILYILTNDNLTLMTLIMVGSSVFAKAQYLIQRIEESNYWGNSKLWLFYWRWKRRF